MPITRPSSHMSSVRVRLLTFVCKWGYRLTIRARTWCEPLIQESALRSGERVLEVSAEGCSLCEVLARQYPAVHFSAVQPAGSSKSVRGPLSNLELLHGDQYCIDCRAASFDKVILSLALHPLRQSDKVALLKEMRRVLRHGGTLHIADFDQPLHRREIHALRGTGYLFGSETAKPHLDGSWLNLIKQTGFDGVRRVNTVSEIVGRIAIIRARRS
ncbi:MAG: methyltransferase domain-containing protein [Bradyrhizobiaceae bacterium]|uniref:Class I SAM-dependent methyltransferase n=1 Tax=Candidatus Afipia apatlaquensis TaxID=2712852 RepID=A0A7C9VL29_9BRAD|nr:class I SAM-dependent methyltransferase [Candidatus Afipia apatlaquensis]RTL76529.1 MAG: methyltransferase domain-containing protein [Bradyrhizobiaceae bacterium]